MLSNIVNYLATGNVPQHLTPKAYQKILKISWIFSCIYGCPFDIGPNLIIKSCLWEDEINDILKYFHDATCGGHFTDKIIWYNVLHYGYCLPTIFKDAKNCMKRCDICQHMGRFVQSYEMSLHPNLMLYPFDKLAIYFMGPLNPFSCQNSCILFCMECHEVDGS